MKSLSVAVFDAIGDLRSGQSSHSHYASGAEIRGRQGSARRVRLTPLLGSSRRVALSEPFSRSSPISRFPDLPVHGLTVREVSACEYSMALRARVSRGIQIFGVIIYLSVAIQVIQDMALGVKIVRLPGALLTIEHSRCIIYHACPSTMHASWLWRTSGSGQRVQHVFFGEPGAAGLQYSEANFVHVRGVVGVGVDHDFDAVLFASRR